MNQAGISTSTTDFSILQILQSLLMAGKRILLRRGVTRTAGPNPGFSSLVRVAVLVTWILKILSEPGVAAITLPPVNWNISNPMFKSSKNDHVIQVKPFDDLDFVCPYHPRHETPDAQREMAEEEDDDDAEEFYTIYMVSKVEYDDCNIYSESQVVMMLNCSNPRQRKRFTILFEPFPSIPNVPEYHPGSTYYFLSTSTGRRSGLGNLYQGACSHQNMKLTIRICCDHNAAKHTNSILPDMTSVHQRKIGHHHRPLSVDMPNHRRSRIHGNADEHNGKHRTEAFQLSLPTPENPLLTSPFFDQVHKENARQYVETPANAFEQDDAFQDSLVHNRGSHARRNCDIYVHAISLLLSASVFLLQLGTASN